MEKFGECLKTLHLYLVLFNAVKLEIKVVGRFLKFSRSSDKVEHGWEAMKI